MKAYIDIIEDILSNGVLKENRTGINTISVSGIMFKHNMKNGFPILTTKKMGLKNIAVELEGFLKGITNKKWYQERKCFIWDEWCNPQKIPYSHDPKIQQQMKECDDLGFIYGYQWRNFNSGNIDQLKQAIHFLKNDPLNRRIIVNAWNPLQLNQMALPPCHYNFQLLSDGKNLDLLWSQRSVDVGLGLPYNISSYALLLSLLAQETNLIPNILCGFLGDCHIYNNHLEQLKKQIERKPFKLPSLKLTKPLWYENGKTIEDNIIWTHNDFELENYQSHDRILMAIAV